MSAENQYRMAPDEIGEVLNKQGHGRCPWRKERPHAHRGAA